MKPALKELALMNGDSIETFEPCGSKFEVTLQAVIGPESTNGEELFDVTVCDHETYAERVYLNGGSAPHAVLEVADFNPQTVYSMIDDLVSKAEGGDWNSIVGSLRKFMRWEFDECQS